MTKVWAVYEGKRPTIGDPWAELPLDDAIRVLALEPQHFLSELSNPPKFGDGARDMTWIGHRYVVIEVGDEEAQADWRPGFYKLSLAPVEVFFRLQIHKGLRNLWRDEWITGHDADGDSAVWFSAVLKADAPESEWAQDNRERIEAEVRTTAAEFGISEWVYVRFRKEKDERVAS